MQTNERGQALPHGRERGRGRAGGGSSFSGEIYFRPPRQGESRAGKLPARERASAPRSPRRTQVSTGHVQRG